MEIRNLGNSDVKVSAIAFGAWAIGGWMWGGAEHKDAIAAIHASLEEGVTSIDTAPIYGQGRSEEIVGEALSSISRDKVQILTKFGMTWEGSKGQFAFDSEDNSGKAIKIYKYAGKESVIRECENSLKRLRTDYIDLYQIHWPDNTTPIDETFEAVLRLKEQGKIRAAGVCNYDVAQVKAADAVVDIVSNQVPFSMVERSIDTEILPYCKGSGKSILAYSPLQRGILTGKIKPGHVFKPGDHRPTTKFYQPANIESINTFLDQLRPMAAMKNATLAQLVLRWTIDYPGITVALAGARDANQAIQNAKAAQIKLEPGEIDFINKHLSSLKIVS